jgi:DNA-binding IclR family transcriptional regulator
MIDFLTANSPAAFTMSELSRALRINVASCHAILAALTQSGHLSRHPTTKTYTLGPVLTAVGSVARTHHELIARATAAATELGRNLGLEVLLSMRAGNDILGLANFEQSRIQRPRLRVGQRMPLRPPSGAVFVAWGSEADIAGYIERGFGGNIDTELASTLRQLVSLVQERGFQVGLKSPARTELNNLISNLSGKVKPDDFERRMRALRGVWEPSIYDISHSEPGKLYDVDFISTPLLDAHGRPLYAFTLYNFAEPITAAQINHYATRLMEMCVNLMRER